MKTGFTITELVVVIIIIGILATLALTHYGSVRERTLNREAQANLRLIIAAARIYRMEVGGYYAAPNTAAINANYRLLLPTPATANWNYLTTATVNTCCAQATRAPAGRTWRMGDTEDDPVSNTCP